MNDVAAFYGQLLTPELRPVFLAAVFVFGCCVGSFLNVCIWRMPLKESVVFAPSHCTNCGAKIAWFDNIPLVSYLVLRGRCRKCRTHFTGRYFWIELATGLLFLLAALLDGDAHAELPLQFAVLSVLIACGMTDAEKGVIPNKLTGFLLLFALADAWLRFDLPQAGLRLAAAAGMFIVLSIVAWGCGRIAGRTALGGGDVKLLAALTAALGVLPVLHIVIAASLAGMAGGAIYARIRKLPLKEVNVRFGSFIAVCGIVLIMLMAAGIYRF